LQVAGYRFVKVWKSRSSAARYDAEVVDACLTPIQPRARTRGRPGRSSTRPATAFGQLMRI
jgi:hypothetical protein